MLNRIYLIQDKTPLLFFRLDPFLNVEEQIKICGILTQTFRCNFLICYVLVDKVQNKSVNK